MKIIIFEGIASSGKTTIEKLLAQTLPNSKVLTEGETLMPLIENRDPEIAVNHLNQFLERFREEKAEYLIIDRFHFTHVFRTKSDFHIFSDFETNLQKVGDVLVVLLTVNPAYIKERIEETILYRKDNWKKGVQGSAEEKSKYYTEQQGVLDALASSSRLPILKIDTTAKSWDKYMNQIIDHLSKKGL